MYEFNETCTGMMRENMDVHAIKDFFEELESLQEGVTGKILVLQNENSFFLDGLVTSPSSGLLKTLL